MTDRQITHAPGCWGWGPKHYECAVREIERLRKMHQDAYQRGLQAGSKGLREMYDAVQAVKRQDAWGNAQLTEALMEAEERAERAEAEIERLRAEVERVTCELMDATDRADDLVKEVEELRAELAAWRELSDHVRVGACAAIWPDRYTDERTRDVAAALKRAAWMAEAVETLRAEVEKVTCELMDAITRADKLAEALEICLEMEERPLIIEMARAALRDHDQENDDA